MADLEVRVQPRSKRNEIAGERNGAVLVRVTAPRVDGKANDAVRKLVAKRLGIPVSRVELVRRGLRRRLTADGRPSCHSTTGSAPPGAEAA